MKKEQEKGEKRGWGKKLKGAGKRGWGIFEISKEHGPPNRGSKYCHDMGPITCNLTYYPILKNHYLCTCTQQNDHLLRMNRYMYKNITSGPSQ